MATLQEQYNLIKEGKGAKDVFLKHAKSLFPELLPNHFGYDDSVNILKHRSVINENLWGVVTTRKDNTDWFKIFNESLNESPIDKHSDTDVYNEFEVQLNGTQYMLDLESEFTYNVVDDDGYIDVDIEEIRINKLYKDINGTYVEVTDPTEIKETHSILMDNKKAMRELEKHMIENIDFGKEDRDDDYDDSRDVYDDEYPNMIEVKENLDAKYSSFGEYKYAARTKYIIGSQGREDTLYFKSEDKAKNYVSQKPKSREYIGLVQGSVPLNEAKEKKPLETKIKSNSTKVSKEVEDIQSHAYNNKDTKKADNVIFDQLLRGVQFEMRNPKNIDKTVEEIKNIVLKNLTKDPIWYTKNCMFGVAGVGYTDDVVALKPSKTDQMIPISKDKVKSNVKDGKSENKKGMPKKVEQMSSTPKSSKGVQKMKMPGAEKRIKLKEVVTGENPYFDTDPSDGDADEEKNMKYGAENYYDKGRKAFDKADYEKAKEYYRYALAFGNSLGWTEKDLPPYDTLIGESVDINGKTVRTYTQNGDTSYNVTYDDGSKDIIYVNNEGWDEINKLHLSNPIEEESMDLRTPEEKKLAKLFDKKPEDLKKKYQDQQKDPNKSLFPKKESINSNLR